MITECAVLAAGCFWRKRHGTVDPGADPSRLSALDIARESRWNLNRQRQLTAAHAPVQIRVISNRRAFDEVP